MSEARASVEYDLNREVLRLIARAARTLSDAKPDIGVSRGWSEDAYHFEATHSADLKLLDMTLDSANSKLDGQLEAVIPVASLEGSSALERFWRYRRKGGA